MTTATATRDLTELRARWRPARARLFLGIAAALRAALEEEQLNAAAQDIGVSWLTAFGAPAVPASLAGDLQFHALAQGTDGLGIVVGTLDPHEPTTSRWWMRDGVLGRLTEIANGGKKR